MPSDSNEGKNRKNDISPYTGRSEAADLQKMKQEAEKPIQVKRDAIPQPKSY